MKNFLKELGEVIKGFFTSKKFEAFLWQTANAGILLLIAHLQDFSFWWIIPAIGLLNYLTKWINTKYIKS